MKKLGPIPGAIIDGFYNDEPFWAGRWTEDEEFEVDGEVTAYRSFHHVREVFIVGGYIESSTGETLGMIEFFQRWLATQKATFVVPVVEGRREELEKLLSAHGFEYEVMDSTRLASA